MSSNLVENILAELQECGLYPSKDKEGMETLLRNAGEDERELHDAMFSILMKHSTKTGLAYIVTYYMYERAKEYE